MTLQELWYVWRTLTPEQRAFVTDKRLDDARTTAAWYAFFAPIDAYSRALQAYRPPAFSGFALVAGFFAGVAVVLATLNASAWFGLFWAVVGGGGYLAWSWLLRFLPPPELRRLLLPLLTLLREDTLADETVALTLDLRGLRADKKTADETVEAARLYRRGRYDHDRRRDPYHKTRERRYVDPWLRARVRLADGSRLRLAVRTHVRHRRIRKQGLSGKYKTKHKHRVKHYIRVRLRAPKKRYALHEAPAAEGVAVEDDGRRYAIYAEHTPVAKYVGKPRATTRILPPEPLLSTVARAFHVLRPVAAPDPSA